MKRVMATSLAFLLGSAALAAQAVNQYYPQKSDTQAAQPSVLTIIRLPTLTEDPACPAPFKARQSGMGELVAAGPGKTHDTGISQRIHLSTISKLKNRAVVSASVTVHGLTPQSRVMPVESGDVRARASRKLEVKFRDDSTGESAADLAVRGFSAVFSIDIDSVTYADGSTWKSEEGLCRVVPDPVMLVSAR